MDDHSRSVREATTASPEEQPGPGTGESEPTGETPSNSGASAASLGSGLLRGGASADPPHTEAGAAHDAQEPTARSSAPHDLEDEESCVLDKLIERLASSDRERDMIGELVGIGEPAAAPLLEALRNEPTAAGKLRLREALVALGDRAVPAIRRCLASANDGDRIRSAVQLAGAIQSRALVASLRSILYCGDPVLRAEAAEALARVAGSQAAAALAEAMASSVDGVAEAAARGVGALALRGDGGAHDPLSVLLGTLDHAVASSDVPLAREVMRALARMHAAEAVPALTRLLHRAPLLRRSRHRSLQRLAIETLARLPDEKAAHALENVARRGRRHLRRYARKRLAERASRVSANDPKAEPLQ